MSEPDSPAEITAWTHRVTAGEPGFAPADVLGVVHAYRRSMELWGKFVEAACRIQLDIVFLYEGLSGDDGDAGFDHTLLRIVRWLERDGWEMGGPRREHVTGRLRDMLEDLICGEVEALIVAVPWRKSAEEIAWESWPAAQLAAHGFVQEAVTRMDLQVMLRVPVTTRYATSLERFRARIMDTIWRQVYTLWPDDLPDDMESIYAQGLPRPLPDTDQ